MKSKAVLTGFLLQAVASSQAPAIVQGHLIASRPFSDRRITESSGVVASRAHPGWLWTMNDSGGEAMLFLTDSSGAALASLAVPAAVNLDWEALGRGPCGAAECLYIGDTGDNSHARRGVTLYRIPEPGPADTGARVTARAHALEVRYAAGPRDVEALYVLPDGGCVLVTKGEEGVVVEFRIPPDAWLQRGAFTATTWDTLPIPVRQSSGRVVTDAALSADGRELAVRTYRDIWFFRFAASGHPTLDAARPACDIAGAEPQGEGIDWWNDSTLVLTSEKGLFKSGTITLVGCPVR